jgi:prepilin-type N-terminal cleavage/methylation domain-containing protein
MKKGFTLVELLAVIIILGLLSTILVTNIMKSYDESKEQAYNLLISDIENATKDYLDTHNDILSSLTPSSPSKTIYLEDLIGALLIKDPVINPKTNDRVGNIPIEIRLETNGDITYNFTV